MSSAVYCDDTQSLSQAITATREAGTCVLDCEGSDLGDKKGQLTIIQIIPYKPSAVSYIIDVLALQLLPGALQPLKDLLSDASITN
jgi:ribonuclease D